MSFSSLNLLKLNYFETLKLTLTVTDTVLGIVVVS